MAKNWIAGAIKNKGGLHRALGVAAGKNIPDKKIEAATHKKGKVCRMAILAQTLAKLRKKK